MASNTDHTQQQHKHQHGVHDEKIHKLVNTVHDTPDDATLSAPPKKTWKQNPLVPAALLGGGVALAIGVVFAQRSGKTVSQKAMEARVLAQGTVLAALFGAAVLGFSNSQEKKVQAQSHTQNKQ